VELVNRLFKGQADPDVKSLKLGCLEFWRLYSKDNSKAAKDQHGMYK
jgi:hypothetical protein